MIERLDNKDWDISEKIRSVFQVSYAVEAELLNAIDFPPLKRKLEEFINSNTTFFGYLKDEELAGVVEIEQTDQAIDINSLVVDPRFFRQGIGWKLMEYVLASFDTRLFTVETGVGNGPASALYLKLGFVEVKQWDTEFGVRKIRFEKKVKQ